METAEATVLEVVEVIGRTLGIEARAAEFGPETALLGEIPELDSLGVVELVVALETHFGFRVEDWEFTGDIFESVGTLSDFVATKRG